MVRLGDNGYGLTSMVILFWTVANLLPRAFLTTSGTKKTCEASQKPKRAFLAFYFMRSQSV